MIVLRVCALGDLVVTGPLLERLGAPFLVAHSEHVALARAAGWIAGGIDADLAGLYALHAEDPDPTRLAPVLRERLANGEPVLVLSRPGAHCDALLRGLRAAGARAVLAHDPIPPAGVHAADHLASAAGKGERRAVPRIELSDELRAPGRALLRELGLDPDAPAIAIHPGAGSAEKRWPLQGWVRVGKGLGATARPLVVCGPADEEPALQLARSLGAPLLRDLPLVELAAALSACRALLGHDSGISHLAAALGIPTLALFGPTDPAQWAPRGPAVRCLREAAGSLSALDCAEVTASANALPTRLRR